MSSFSVLSRKRGQYSFPVVEPRSVFFSANFHPSSPPTPPPPSLFPSPSAAAREEPEDMLRAFDAFPLDSLHLTAIFLNAENPTTRLPALLIDALCADTNGALVNIDVSNIFKKCHATHGEYKYVLEK